MCGLASVPVVRCLSSSVTFDQRFLHSFLLCVLLSNCLQGKTETAKKYGRVLRELGMLSDGECITRGASTLVGAHEGATKATVNALMDAVQGKVRRLCRLHLQLATPHPLPTALNCVASICAPCPPAQVLLIDEAHQLAESAYGREALGVLVERVQGTAVEDFAVVMCGYDEKVLAMIRTCDPGLARRFRVEDAFHFPDYTNDELEQIMLLKAPAEGVSVTPAVAKAVVAAVLGKQRMKPNFGNAGAVANLLQTGKARRYARGGTLERDASTGGVVLVESDFYDSVATSTAQDVLAHLAGAEGVKAQICRLEKLVRLAKRRAELSGDAFDPSPFLKCYAFVGPPVRAEGLGRGLGLGAPG
jgi:hypothetical protein